MQVMLMKRALSARRSLYGSQILLACLYRRDHCHTLDLWRCTVCKAADKEICCMQMMIRRWWMAGI